MKALDSKSRAFFIPYLKQKQGAKLPVFGLG